MFNPIIHSEATTKEGTVTTVTGSNVGNASSNHSVTVDNDDVLGSAEHINNNVKVMKDFMVNE